MFDKLLTPLTTATSTGVAIRYITTIVGSIVAILGVLGWLTPEQSDALTREIPGLLGAVGGLVAVGITTYATLTKAFSNKAAEAAKAIDSQVPTSAPVVIQTPAGVPDIVIPAAKT